MNRLTTYLVLNSETATLRHVTRLDDVNFEVETVTYYDEADGRYYVLTPRAEPTKAGAKYDSNLIPYGEAPLSFPEPKERERFYDVTLSNGKKLNGQTIRICVQNSYGYGPRFLGVFCKAVYRKGERLGALLNVSRDYRVEDKEAVRLFLAEFGYEVAALAPANG